MSMKLNNDPSGKWLFLRALGEFFQYIFVIFLVTYLMLLLVDIIWEDSASSVLNLNYLLIAVIVLGIPAVLTARSRKNERAREPIGVKDAVIIGCAANAGLVIVWIKTRDIGWPSYLIAIVSCILIIILSVLILKGDDEGEDKKDQ